MGKPKQKEDNRNDKDEDHEAEDGRLAGQDVVEYK